MQFFGKHDKGIRKNKRPGIKAKIRPHEANVLPIGYDMELKDNGAWQ